MGNPISDLGPERAAGVGQAVIRNFYTGASWIEGAAVDQVNAVASIEDVTEVAAFPDLHPGKFGPVGVAIRSSNLHPALIGNDIGCGMSLYRLDLPARKLRLDRAADRLRRLSEAWDGNAAERLLQAGLQPVAFPTSLGSVGGGNHFCEVQAADEVFASASGIDPLGLYLLVHSGSRAFGDESFGALSSEQQMKIASGSATAAAYLASHDSCVAWARLNRDIVAERAAELLGCEVERIASVPHNLVAQGDDGFLHRKGAALANPGDLVPVAGSRAALSYLVCALPKVSEALNSLSHGAGRKYDRASMRHRVGRTRFEREQLHRNNYGGLAICEDRDLLLEEAAQAYKSAKTVVDDLASFGVVDVVASMRPLITFKKANLHIETHDRRVSDEKKRRTNGGHVMTEIVNLLITSGSGPEECRLAVGYLVDEIQSRAAKEKLAVKVMEGGSRVARPRSVVVAVSGEGAETFARPLIGSVKFIFKSPVRPGHKRQNWFVGVERLDEAVLGVDAPMLDLSEVRLDTMRSSGAGGQHVNTTDSAVRATHIPTGLSTVARDERSQHRNKQVALRRLAGMLRRIAEEVHERGKKGTFMTHKSLERGNAVMTLKR